LSPQEVDRARSDRIAAEEGLAAARADELRLTQELAHYGIVARPDGNPQEEDSVPVRSPLAGAVIERQVSPGTAVTAGTPLFVISDLSSVWITAEFDESHVASLAVGAPVEVQVTAYPGEVFRGTITGVGDVINPATRRVTIRCEVPNQDGRLKPQMFARVMLTSPTARRMLVIPERAVQEMEGQTVVFARDPRGRFQRRPIVVGATVGGLTEIIAGADDDDVIATAGAFLIKSELMKPQAEEQ
jgi:cobalt-zinc-cadmium efflux system membrane fusion protein